MREYHVAGALPSGTLTELLQPHVAQLDIAITAFG